MTVAEFYVANAVGGRAQINPEKLSRCWLVCVRNLTGRSLYLVCYDDALGLTEVSGEADEDALRKLWRSRREPPRRRKTYPSRMVVQREYDSGRYASRRALAIALNMPLASVIARLRPKPLRVA